MSSPDDSDGNAQVLLLTVDQAAALCQISRDKMYEWTREPGFPVIVGGGTRGHQIRIHARLFDEWLERRAAQGRTAEESAA